MAATNDTSSPERNRGWFQEELTEVNEPFRRLLEGYSKISPSEVVNRVNEVRKRGFAANPYPCIGFYGFTNLTLITHPLYPTILDRLNRPGATYIDIGCCFGQDLRQLVFDGVPSENLIGLDIEKPLVELGYELFLDRSTLKSQFVIADVFEGPLQASCGNIQSRGGIDVMHCSAFFHLFTLDQQLVAATHMATLMKVGGLIVGRQVGNLKPGNVPGIPDNSDNYRHDISTFGAMWNKVGEATDTRWNVEGTMDMLNINFESPLENENSRRLLFTVTRLA
ncbi:hypothetical protein F5Y08DRAFT_312446 [Xylaria arbuscula]|nr:hypothetical protein F5Y08DRAFT_312446 [Xylaria arbuscula]